MTHFRWIAFAFCIFSTFAKAETKAPDVLPAQAWVTSNKYDYYTKTLDKYAGDGYVDVAYEQQVHVATQATYMRRVMRILTDAGVQNAPNISVSYDPTYSRLTFHSVDIIRDGKRINALDISKVKTIASETDKNLRIYNGSLSAELFIEDVRKGDVIDYSYTITGSNPITSEKYCNVFTSSFHYPFYHVYFKVVIPAARELHILDINDKAPYTVKSEQGQKAYEWKLENLKPIPQEDYTPSWYNSLSYIMVSEYNNWKEVAEWANKLYPESVRAEASLKALISQIRKDNKTDEARVLGALRFVQDEVRYLGIEMGSSAHTPHDPNQTLRQRYGDCKDKVYLLCTILRAMNIKADPVLVSSVDKQTIGEYLPGSGVFDHVIVRVSLSGKDYWLDATNSLQRGSLDDIDGADYRLGLVVMPGTESLSTIPYQNTSRKEILEVLDIPDVSGDAKLKVVSRYYGSEADDIRSQFDGHSQTEIEQKYKEFYASFFGGVEIDSLFTLQDSVTGVFECQEYYSLHDVWTQNGNTKEIFFYPYVLSSQVHKPTNTSRRTPFGLNYPMNCKELIVVHAPFALNIQDEHEEVDCGAFHFKGNVNKLDRTLTLGYEYHGRKDCVLPSELPAYMKSYQKMSDFMSYGLKWDETPEPLKIPASTRK